MLVRAVSHGGGKIDPQKKGKRKEPASVELTRSKWTDSVRFHVTGIKTRHSSSVHADMCGGAGARERGGKGEGEGGRRHIGAA